MVSENVRGNQRLLPGTPVADRHLSIDRGGIQSWRHVLRVGGAFAAALLIGVIGTMPAAAAESPTEDWQERLAASVMSALAEHGVPIVDGAIVGDGSRYGDGERHYTGHTVSNPASGTSAAVWKRSYRSTNLVGPLGGLTLNDGFLRYRPDRRAHVRSADPAQGAASVFDDLLEARGLVIRNRPRAGSAPREAHRAELAAISSPPLGRIVQRAGVYSENTAAEMLLKEIGYRALRRVPITAAAKFTYAPDRPWFTDVPLGSADTAAARVSEAGLMALCDDDGRRFCPDDLMSRADLAVILRDVADLRRVGTAARPIDTADHPEAEAIAAVMAAGLMWSCDGEARLFCPDEPVSEFAAASGVMFAVAQLNGASLGVVPPGPLCGRGNPRCQSATRLDVAIFLHVALDAARLGASPRS